MKNNIDLPDLNKDRIRHIVVEPKKDIFPKIDGDILKKVNEREELLKRAIELLKKCSAFIDVMRFELGEDVDQSDLEKQVNEFLAKVEKK